jgi:hypothetical protein
MCGTSPAALGLATMSRVRGIRTRLQWAAPVSEAFFLKAELAGHPKQPDLRGILYLKKLNSLGRASLRWHGYQFRSAPTFELRGRVHVVPSYAPFHGRCGWRWMAEPTATPAFPPTD